MDDVGAVLILLPDDALPDATSVAEADAIVLVAPDDAAAFDAQRAHVAAALELGPPLYLAVPPIESGLARAYLRATMQPGVYGVASRPPASVDQLRYLEGLLEDLELRAGIRPGLTAMAVGFEHPRALDIMSSALQAMRDSADRMTWIAFNHEELAQTLGVAPDSPTVTAASAQAVLTAAAYDLPVVYGSVEQAEHAAALGFRGCATIDPVDLGQLRTIFTRPSDEPSDPSPSETNQNEEVSSWPPP